MKTGLSILAAAGAGALATYFLDAQDGRRRRTVLRDKVYGKLGHFDEAGKVATTDLRNRLQGTIRALARFQPQGEVTDDVLVARVRSKLGRNVSHPGSIQATASGGTVTLQGPILASEVKRAMRAVWAVPGVHHVVDRLESHDQPGNVPGLQGGGPRTERLDIAQRHWAPATRLLAGAGGTSLAACALMRRNLASPLLLAGGVALLARAATNSELRQLFGGRGRRGIDFSKTVHFDVPVERLYEFWSDFANLPRFMRNVRSVRRISGDTWEWEVAGPLGASVRWNSAVTQRIPNKVLAWSTTPEASVQHAGLVRFEPEGSGTRMHVRMSYNPVAGALGHAVASLFGADPLAEMDQDLMRLKSFFHTGKPARDAAQPGAAPAAGGAA